MALTLSFWHNALSFIYCIIIIPIVIQAIRNDDFTNYELILQLSMGYFPLSMIINYYEKERLFIIHHIIVIIVLFLPYVSDYNLYVKFIYYALLAEISTVVLTLKFMIKEGTPVLYWHFKNYIDLTFMIVFWIVRIGYLTPIVYYFSLELDYEKNYYCTILTNCLIILMMTMNYYWAVAIIIKFYNAINEYLSKKNLKN